MVRPWRATVTAVGLAALTLAWVGFINLDTFFNRQMRDPDVFAAFSTRETVPARAALEQHGAFESMLASATMLPSVVSAYMTPDLLTKMRPFDPGGDLPYRGSGPGFIFLETEHDQAIADEVARMYPEAPPQLYAPPDGAKPIVDGFQLDPDLIASHRGLLATYRGADGTANERHEPRAEVASDDVPVPQPADMTWRAWIAIDTTGEYSFRVPVGFQLRIDEALLTEAAPSGVRVRLIRGNHALELSGTVDRSDPPRLEWRSPLSGDWQTVPSEMLFVPPTGGTGLRLTLQASTGSGGQPADEVVDPVVAHYYHVSPFSRLHLEPNVWSADWTGQLDTPISGMYGFSLDHSQTATVWLDDQQILGNVDAANDTRNRLIPLQAGRHSIRVHYEKTVDGSPWINLYWTRPGAGSAVIPASALFPPPPTILGPAR